MTAPALTYDADFAPAVALIADPTRAAILRALLPDRPLAAGELARLAGVSAATVSFHLAKLLDGGMIAVVRQGSTVLPAGRPSLAAALEALGLISPELPVRTLRQSREVAALAQALTCYYHLAGRAGVELLDGLLRRGLIQEKSSGRTERSDTPALRFEVTGAGAKVLGSFGLNIGEIRRSRRRFAGSCIDWTQRRGHLNGALAAAITSLLFELDWIERGSPGQRRRSVRVTPAGAEGLACTFGLDLA